MRVAAALGYRTVLWTLDTIDWQDPPPERILQRVLPKVQSGSIVLMHPKASIGERPLLSCYGDWKKRVCER